MTDEGVKEQQGFSTADLSEDECVALAFTQTKLGLGSVDEWNRAVAIAAKAHVGEAELRQRVQRGLAQLAEKGIVEVERDGHRDLVPLKLHDDRLVGGRIVMSDRN